MVHEKQTKRERNIKSKLMAAIAMLLVSSIMMVSTTYAWFTLSTAPEVTGITTAVGANGNLEMALLPAVNATAGGSETVYYNSVSDALAAIKTGSSDSMAAVGQTKQAANITWGNLVDLSVEQTASGTLTYGMENIVLYPSALNLAVGGTTLTEGALLNIPEYGSDGRVAKLVGVGTTGTYTGDGFYEGTGFGVRAVGKSSGMTARQLAYTSAKATADSAANRAAAAASSSLNIGGNALASIAVKAKMSSGATFTDDEIKPISDTYAHLLASTGAVGYLKTALTQYIVAAVISNATDAEYTTLSATLENATLESVKGMIPADMTALTDTITKLEALEGKISGAKATVDTMIENSDEHKWADIYNSLKILGDPDNMTLNGQPIDYYTANNMEKIGELVAAVGTGVKVVVTSGIYVEMADFCGKISGNVKIEGISYGQFQNLSVSAVMEANPSVATPHMNLVKLAINTLGFKTEEGAGSAKMPISDFYGYIVDMAFRTNASDSYLQLQTEAEDRIYQGNTANASTMGGGSTMSFSFDLGSGSNGDNVKSMMAGIRVVFFDPMDNTVKAFARLDTDNISTTETVSGEEANPVTTYTLTASLYLCDQSGNWMQNADATVQNEINTLIPLTQNAATALSVMVYLDGESIGNESISSANINGKMNLQFSSSATLVPMEYSDLHNGTGNTVTEPAASESTGG